MTLSCWLHGYLFFSMLILKITFLEVPLTPILSTKCMKKNQCKKRGFVLPCDFMIHFVMTRKEWW